MKLYTEEEIIRTFGFGMNEMTFKGFMNAIKHIELPTDEEIGKGRDEHIPIDEIDMWSERFYFTIGAKWMRDKIQGGGK